MLFQKKMKLLMVFIITTDQKDIIDIEQMGLPQSESNYCRNAKA